MLVSGSRYSGQGKARIRYKAIQRDMEARKEEEALKHKQELMRRKNLNCEKCFESGRERAAIKVQKWRENRIESNKRARRCAEAGEALHLKRLEFAMAEKAKEARRCTRARCIMANCSR